MLQIIVDFGSFLWSGGEISLRIYGYGLMLVLGFLSGIYLAMWRAERCGESRQAMATCGILALVGGIVGARVAFVIENWRDFARADRPLVAVFDVTSGGLIFIGGVVLAVAMVFGYLRVKRLPVRRYLDMLAVSLMLGLAFGRAGCFLNGCCYGGRCDEHWALGQAFPMFSKPLVKLDGSPGPFSRGTDSPSPVFAHQIRSGQLAAGVVDERLVNSRTGFPRPPRLLHGRLNRDQLVVMMGTKEEAKRRFLALSEGDEYITAGQWRQGLQSPDGVLRGSETWDEAAAYSGSHPGMLSFEEFWRYLSARRQEVTARFDSDHDGVLTGEERQKANSYLQENLFDLAGVQRALPVKPAQLIGMFNALVLAGLLMWFFRLRVREGQVFALMLIIYPITRFILESIRDDNNHNLMNLVFTHNQVSSVIIALAGITMWLGLRRVAASAGPIWSQRHAET